MKCQQMITTIKSSKAREKKSKDIHNENTTKKQNTLSLITTVTTIKGKQ